MLQATRPQTLGDAVTDSPVGQLAWIAEKFREWTDSTDRPEDAIDRDQLLTTISVYWFTCTANSSARLYYEYGHSGAARRGQPSSAPTGLRCSHARSPGHPRSADRSNNIVHWSAFDRGGHFAALEQPGLWPGRARSSAAFVALKHDRRPHRAPPPRTSPGPSSETGRAITSTIAMSVPRPFASGLARSMREHLNHRCGNAAYGLMRGTLGPRELSNSNDATQALAATRRTLAR